MKQLLIIIALSTILFTGYGCKKKAGLFAPEFVCKVDGDRFKPKSTSFKSNPLDIKIYKDTLIIINALNSPQSIYIGLRDINGISFNKYKLEELSLIQGSVGIASYDNNTSLDQYVTDSNNTGYIEILNIDYDKKEINAKFEFNAYNNVKKEIVRITDGKINASFTQK